MFGNILTECRVFKNPSDDLGGGINNIISSGLGVVVYLCGVFLFLFLGWEGLYTNIHISFPAPRPGNGFYSLKA